MTTFQHKDRVTRHIKDEGIDLVCGSPRIYVMKKDKNREVDTLYAYPEVRIDANGLVIQTSSLSKWNIGDRVLFHKADLAILDEI
jgi:hypothetical protein